MCFICNNFSDNFFDIVIQQLPMFHYLQELLVRIFEYVVLHYVKFIGLTFSKPHMQLCKYLCCGKTELSYHPLEL